MTKYTTQERAKYWPVSPELMAQYRDGTHNENDRYGLYWTNQECQRHRDSDKPALIWSDGTLIWYQNGQLHRDGDKPAHISADGGLWWCQNGQRHRFCGPAVIKPDGTLEWWINHKNITQEVNKWLDGEEWRGTPLQIFEFQLRFL